jgi:hypothetical protein
MRAARRITIRAAQATLLLALSCLWAWPGGALAADTDEEGLAGPDVRIIAEADRTIYEFRQNGQLRMVRIEPKFGPAYFLVPRDPSKGFGDLERADMLLPNWVLFEF